MEVWKDIVGFEGLYKISSKGQVKSCERKTFFENRSGFRIEPEKILKFGINKGYKFVSLSKGDKQKSYRIHRLVGEHFIDNPNNLPQINHKDCNKENNNFENLEWVTNKENFIHAIENNLVCRGEKSGKSKLTEKQVLEIIKDGRSNRVLGKIYGVNSSVINSIKNRKYWTHITNGKEIVKNNNHNRGTKCWKSKLNEEQVLDILSDERGVMDIAKDYNVSHSIISNIKSGKSWKHLQTSN